MLLKRLLGIGLFAVIVGIVTPVFAKSVEPGQTHVLKASFCLSFKDAEHVWNIHKEGDYSKARKAFLEIALQRVGVSPRCRVMRKPGSVMIVEIFDKATLPWGIAGMKPSYFMSVRFRGGPNGNFEGGITRFMVGFVDHMHTPGSRPPNSIPPDQKPDQKI